MPGVFVGGGDHVEVPVITARAPVAILLHQMQRGCPLAAERSDDPQLHHVVELCPGTATSVRGEGVAARVGGPRLLDNGLTLEVIHEAVVRFEVGADDGLGDIGDEEYPREPLVGLAFQREGLRMLGIDVDGRHIGNF